MMYTRDNTLLRLRFTALAGLLAVAYWVYQHFLLEPEVSAPPRAPAYDVSNLEEQPLSAIEVLEHHWISAERVCEHPAIQQWTGQGKEECLSVISSRRQECGDQMLASMPPQVNSAEAYARYGKAFLACVLSTTLVQGGL